ncbi:hypothetical protein OED52_02285 [Rhodococcus sp. Z13]|uniref:Uncharacterized protein n=1 Tax=Rhodococcus sacchari TaxID=2962047 RepID=A0ACD4DH72_9NOCA|nr:hypothetical protein [Rhodococcus sp. Z13]UYP19424.1 hypothetical protein OED52_02285 [Rhodococcus sp. Z13]
MSASTRQSRWAKSPDFSEWPGRAEAVATQTAIDKINYLESGQHEVQCRECGTCVLVRKNSLAHTSVQWQDDPDEVCPVFRDTAEERGRSITPRRECPRLRASIRQAVLDGVLPVPEEG